MENSLVLGFFDGVHIAHKTVIESALSFSKNVIVITFKEAPNKFFNKDFKYIYNRKKSLQKLKDMGVDKIVELDFQKYVNMPAETYLENIIKEYKPLSISTGFNHTFGYNRTGTPDLIQKYAEKYKFTYLCIPAQNYKENIVSSTLIRDLLKKGNIKEATILLESNFSISGKVIHGAQIGRKIGFPTANIEYPKDIIQIPYGVYSAKYNNKKCLLNWGVKPTINNSNTPIAEVHIINFNENIYNQNIEIDIIDKIRNEQKFNSINELKEQIAKDIEACLKL